MTDHIWHVAQDGEQVPGTHTSDDVIAMLGGSPGSSFLVWRQGQEDWVTPTEVPELAERLARPSSGPAPLPGPVPDTDAAAPGPAAAASVAQRMGFVRSLFDLGFENLVTPKMIAVLYVIAMIFVGLGLIAMIVSGFTSLINGVRFGAWGMALFGVVWVVVSPLLALLYLALIRVFFEVVVILFKIREDLGAIARRGDD
jgi:hypothetical protein